MSKREPTMRFILAKVADNGKLHYLTGSRFDWRFEPGDPRDVKWKSSYERDEIERIAELLIAECEDFCIVEIVDGWNK